MLSEKEKWFKQKHEDAHSGIFVDCEMCIHHEDFAFPREGDFEEWCEKRNDYIEKIDVDNGCEYFDMGNINDWDY